jgi:hypothetical protein
MVPEKLRQRLFLLVCKYFNLDEFKYSFEGMLEPTSGNVTIKGMDNQLHIEEVRHNLGFCPQYGRINKNYLREKDFFRLRYSL